MQTPNKINTFRGFRNTFLLILLSFQFSVFSNSQHSEQEQTAPDSISAIESSKETKHDDVDITKIAFEHILDSHYWHFWDEGHDAVVAPLPVIIYSSSKGFQIFSSSKFEHGHASYNGYSLVEEDIISSDPEEKIYDLSITKNVLQLLLSSALLLWIFISIANAYKTTGVTTAPKGKQSFFEPVILFVRDDIAKENIGQGSEKYVPYLLTVFFLILLNNVLGMIPISANLTGNIAFTLSLAFITLLVTTFSASKAYWKHIFLPKPLALWWLLMPIELVGVFSKPFALMIRLFANIAGGHIMVISLIGLIFLFNSIFIAPVSIGFTLFIDILECLVALLQAYIFTMLTALFIGTAREDHSHSEEGHEATTH